jgi:predicted esterase
LLLAGAVAFSGEAAAGGTDELGEDHLPDRPVLRTTSSHPIKYYLSLPKDYKRENGKRWPVLVCVDGSASEFENMANVYRRARGSLPYLVVSPCVFSNTNALRGVILERYRACYADEVIQSVRDRLAWDAAGLVAILKDLREQHDVEDRMYLTGHSGGGRLTYQMIFAHPDLLAGAAPECPNFFGLDVRRYQGQFSAAARNFPIHVILGERDHMRQFGRGGGYIATPLEGCALVAGLGLGGSLLARKRTRKRKALAIGALATVLGTGLVVAASWMGLNAQNDRAIGLLHEFGYPNVKRTVIGGMAHALNPEAVLDTFRPYVQNEKRRSDPLAN